MNNLPIGSVILWENETIPDGWAVLTAAIDKYILGAEVDGDVGSSGGSNTHSHPNTGLTTDQVADHTHTAHEGTGSTGGKTNVYTGGSGTEGVNPGHTHGGNHQLLSAGGHAHNLEEAQSANHEPQNVKRVLIKRVS